MEESRRETLIVGALCAAWYCASSASNVVGKLVLTRFPFPMTVTMVQLLATVLISPPAFWLARVRRAPALPRRYWMRVLVPLAFAKFLTTVCSQVSIWRVPVSYAHTGKFCLFQLFPSHVARTLNLKCTCEISTLKADHKKVFPCKPSLQTGRSPFSNKKKCFNIIFFRIII